jgi:hypothetical protein
VCFYFAKFQSLVRYGTISWGGEKEHSTIMTMQNRFLRIMVGVNRRNSCRAIFKELRIGTVTSLHIYDVLIYFRKYTVILIQLAILTFISVVLEK